MATRLKTVQFAFPTLASLVNNTLTNLTQRTIYLPETGTKTFRSVVAHVTCDDIISATGGTLTTKTLNFRLAAIAYTSVANANTLSNSGENHSFHLTADFTAHFATNWSGSSMTADFQVQINQSTGTTVNLVNVCVTLEITYEYDDTSTTQVKSVMIPLNAAVGALTTSATTYDTFPALDTYLPETSKAYRDIFVVVQGNEARNAATTDHTLSIAVGSTTVTTGSYEGALASDRWFRYVFDILAAGFAGQASTQNFQLSDTIGRNNHLQAYAVVTYEYNESTSTAIMQSVLLPFGAPSQMGGTTSADFIRIKQDLWIEEPATITGKNVAAFVHWTQNAATIGLNMRLGTGSFVTYTDAASVLCGGVGAMVRNDAAFTLARGKNALNLDIYRTNATTIGFGLCGFFLVNYTSAKHASGSGVHNKTVLLGVLQNGTAAIANVHASAAVAPEIPEADYFVNSAGARLVIMGSSCVYGVNISVERLAGEVAHSWERVYADNLYSDAELGVFTAYGDALGLFLRWPGDASDARRMNIESARIWTITFGQQAWPGLSMVLTYHSITKSVSGTVSGSGGGTVTIDLMRTTGEKLLTTTRAGNGAYAFTWYDDTEAVYTCAREDATHLGRSEQAVAT